MSGIFNGEKHKGSFHTTLQKWALKWWLIFARSVNVSDEMIHRLRLDMAVGLSLQGVLDEILTDWIRRGMSEEEMDSFRNKLERADDKTIFNTSVYRRLQTDFGETQVLVWNTLNKAVKGRVLTKPVYFCGEKTTLLRMRQFMPSPEHFDNLLKNTIDASQIQEFMQDNDTILTKPENCHRYPYFLPRTLAVQLYVFPEIFSKQHTTDIFIVKNIEWSVLQRYANHTQVIRSTNIKEIGTASCVALEDDAHLCKFQNNVNKNIHFISYEDSVGENPRFIWESTIGAGTVMLQHIMHERIIEFGEEEYFKSHYSAKGTSTICLYGVSGIGKTSLLRNLYSHILKDYKDRLLVFYNANRLLQHIQESLISSNEQEINLQLLVKCIAKHYSRTNIGESLLGELIFSEYIFTEIFIDSLDDMPPSKFNEFLAVIKVINSSTNTRITLACAPQLQIMLSEYIPLIKCELLNLTSAEQSRMFQCYWTGGHEKQCPKPLVQFSRKCCSKLADNTSYNIVGAALQIRLLAEMYRTKADEIGSRKTQAFHLAPTQVDIYKVVKKSINKMVKSDRGIVLYFTMKYLNEYFPDVVAREAVQNKKEVCRKIDKDDLVLLGHRISKQFFVATYLSYYVQEMPETVETSFVFEDLLDKIFYININGKINRTYSFVRFFIDKMCIERKLPPSGYFKSYLAKRNNSTYLVGELATNGLFGLLYLTICSGNVDYSFEKFTTHEYAKLVLTATKSGNKHVVDFICNQSMFNLEIFNNGEFTKDWQLHDIIMTPLHVAIRRGCLTLFHLFLEKYGHLVYGMKGLIHVAVDKTYGLHQEAILNKVQIVKYLLYKLVTDKRSETDIINEQIGCGLTPLLMDKVHICLISLLLGYGADPCVKENRTHNAISHILPSYCSLDEFETFLDQIRQVNQTHVLLLRNAFSETPYQIAAKHLPLNAQVVDKISSILADFIELENFHTDNFVYQLIRYGYNEIIIGVTLKYQSGWIQGRYKNNSTTLLHVAAEFCNVSATKYLLSLGLDTNMTDVSGKTPLHVACKHSARTKKQLKDIKTVIEDLLENHADVSITDKEGKTALHYLNDVANVPSRRSSTCSSIYSDR